ncbi:MAG TPA: thiamine phosphate synthase [Sandaracinaceae bacterium LLY-WYZ-13_1]|nr:thiamine phosphate synthase [Sandaracinaceae bacterium LLY-WYZ-13_1]
MRGLYAIVDPDACAGRDPERVAAGILAGGCARLQLRAKAGTDSRRLALAHRIRARCAVAGVSFVMNDRPDLAVLCRADALHLGQDDLRVADARRIVGAMEIGRSSHDEAQATAVADAGADVLAFGPVFETTSKANPDPVVGIDRLRAVCEASPLPVVAIGGLTVDRAVAVKEAGARWGAAIGALCGAEDPEAAARALHYSLGGA